MKVSKESENKCAPIMLQLAMFLTLSGVGTNWRRSLLVPTAPLNDFSCGHIVLVVKMCILTPNGTKLSALLGVGVPYTVD